MFRLLSRCLQRHHRPLHLNRSPFHVSSPSRDIFKIQDDAHFKDKVLGSKRLVIVDFFASWCSPCMTMNRRLEAAVAPLADSVDLALVDVEVLDVLADRYEVVAIPAVFALKNGTVVSHYLGLKDDDQVAAFIEGALKK